jgi:hypothetical protein
MTDLIERLERLGDDFNRGYKDRRRVTCKLLREAAQALREKDKEIARLQALHLDRTKTTHKAYNKALLEENAKLRAVADAAKSVYMELDGLGCDSVYILEKLLIALELETDDG